MEGINEVSPPEFSSSDDTVAAENDENPEPEENLPPREIPGRDRETPRGRGAGAARSPLRLFGELRRLASHNLPGLREEEPETGRRRRRVVYRTGEEESADS